MKRRVERRVEKWRTLVERKDIGVECLVNVRQVLFENG